MVRGKKSKENEFGKIFTENYSRLYYYALSYVRDSETCRDIVGDVFESAWDDYDRLVVKGELTPYLYSSVGNRCIDYLRRQAIEDKYREIQLKAAEGHAFFPNTEMDERLERVAGVIERMPSRTRFVLEECFFNNKKYREVAEVLEITTDGVKKHIMKALKMLRDEFL